MKIPVLDVLWLCGECGAIVRYGDILQAANPFNHADSIQGCPECFSVGNWTMVCDEPGCTRPATVGTPTASGYRSTCSAHDPEPKP